METKNLKNPEVLRSEERLKKIGVYDDIVKFCETEDVKSYVMGEFVVLDNQIQKAFELAPDEFKEVLLKVKNVITENEEAFFNDFLNNMFIRVSIMIETIEKFGGGQQSEVFREHFNKKTPVAMEIVQRTADSVRENTYILFIKTTASYFLENSEE